METGTIENNRRTGRSPKWTKRDNNQLLSVLVKKNKKATVRTILRLFNENKTDTVCLDTTRVELRGLGMFRRCIKKYELIYWRNHTKRIKFAKTYKKWAIDDWKRSNIFRWKPIHDCGIKKG